MFRRRWRITRFIRIAVCVNLFARRRHLYPIYVTACPLGSYGAHNPRQHEHRGYRKRHDSKEERADNPDNPGPDAAAFSVTPRRYVRPRRLIPYGIPVVAFVG